MKTRIISPTLKFTNFHRCPKCSSFDNIIRYIEEQDWMDFSKGRNFFLRLIGLQDERVIYKEHIRVICGSCGYFIGNEEIMSPE